MVDRITSCVCGMHAISTGKPCPGCGRINGVAATDAPQVRVEDLLVQFGTLRLQPGDILAMMVKHRLSSEGIRRTQELMRPLVPEGVSVLVLDEGMTLARVAFGGR